MSFSGDRALPFRLDLMICFCLLVLVAAKKALAEQASSFQSVCQRPALQVTFLPQHDQCSLYDPRFDRNATVIKSRVLEMNGTMLERALNLIQTRNGAYSAVLFYAEWCPFSKSLRPTFDTLSLLFPSIYHFAVEESAFRPSSLSQYGVHSFPSLFLHNKTLRIRYFGPRTIEAFSRFYRDITGLDPLHASTAVKEEIDSARRIMIDDFSQERRENYSFTWVNFTKKRLEDDMYLTLATLFLMLRFCHYIIPKLTSRLRNYWVQEGFFRQFYKALLRKYPLLHTEQDRHGIRSSSTVDKGKRVRMETLQDKMVSGRGGVSVSSWSSSSLAPVTIAEGSSSRAGISDEGCEMGRVNRGSFWG